MRRRNFNPSCHPERSEGSRVLANESLRYAQNDGRAGFTLFELILAIALSAALLTLIGTAINLYLVRVDASRARVEEAQLARSVLAMIADDIRATTIYQPQDTSVIAQLMSKTTAYDADAIDAKQSSSGPGGAFGAGGATSISSITGASSTGQASSGDSNNGDSDTDNTLPLGISGSAEELYIDVTRLPKQDELFNGTTGYTNAASPNAGAATPAGGTTASAVGAPASDLKTVHYCVRPGEALEPGAASATSLDPAAQQRVGGLVRQEISRAPRQFAEQNGNSDLLDSGQALIAPEVVRIEFHYFNGGEVIDYWDMKEQKSLPMAVEVCVWLRSGGAAGQPIASQYDAASLANTTREYRQVVNLPMAQVMNSGQSGGSSGSSTTDSTGGSSSDGSSNGSSSGTGSSFD